MEYQDMRTLQGEDNNYYMIYVSVSQSLISPIKLLLANFVIKGKKQEKMYHTHMQPIDIYTGVYYPK